MPFLMEYQRSARGVLLPVYRFQAVPPPRKRPAPDKYDRFANRYQDLLVAAYDGWAAETTAKVEGALRRGASIDESNAIVQARLEDLQVEMMLLGRRTIAEAAGLGLGRRLGKAASSFRVLNAVADLQRTNDGFIQDSLMPTLTEKLTEKLTAAIENAEGPERSQLIREALLTGRSDVAPYSGGAVVAVFEVQRQAGIEENQARQNQGEPLIPVRWVLDARAVHCGDDPKRGTFGCLSMEGEYPLGWASLPTVPAGNVSCIGNAVLEGTVVDALNIEAAYRIPYSGPVLELTTRSGLQVSVTPNHPILTPKGWIAAQVLGKGDYVISGPSGQTIAKAIHHDQNHVPSRIEQVWRSLVISGGPGALGGTFVSRPEHFHGDGRFVNGKVDVIWADGQLGGEQNPTVPEKSCQLEFSGGGLSHPALSGQRTAVQVVRCTRHSTYGIMTGVGEPLALFRRSLGHPQKHAIGTVARFNTILPENAPDSPAGYIMGSSESLLRFASHITGWNIGEIDFVPAPAYAESIGTRPYEPLLAQIGGYGIPADSQEQADLLSSLSRAVECDEIVGIREFPFSGHVYDLQSYGALYNANGLLVHNCRCHLEADFGAGWERA